MISKLVRLGVLLLALASAGAMAEYDSATGMEKACLAYTRAADGQVRSYKVRGFIVAGDEVRDFAVRRGHQYKSYNIFKYYFVVQWQDGGYTALELPHGDALPRKALNVRDQRRRQWTLKDGWTDCN